MIPEYLMAVCDLTIKLHEEDTTIIIFMYYYKLPCYRVQHVNYSESWNNCSIIQGCIVMLDILKHSYKTKDENLQNASSKLVLDIN